MVDNRHVPRSRTLHGGKIVFNLGRSVVDCTVRNLSSHGACLEVQSLAGIPDSFILLIGIDRTRVSCRMVWRSEPRIGVAFDEPMPERRNPAIPDRREAPESQVAARDMVRSEMLALRAGLDEVAFGVVLLDDHLRAQFINRAFRTMWRLPDAKAESKPSYVALLQHGRETGAYEIPADQIEAHIAERVAHVTAGNPAPCDIRLTNGQAVRVQCTALPAGGRMLSYTLVTDIVRHSDELDVLRAALDVIDQGIVLLDANLTVTFLNRAARTMWHLAELSRGRFTYADIVANAYELGLYDVPPETLDTYVAERIAHMRAGNPRPVDLKISDGRVIRAQCTALPDGGRMISYVDVSDLARHEAPALVPNIAARERVD